MRNSVDRISHILDTIKEKITELENMALLIIQLKHRRKARANYILSIGSHFEYSYGQTDNGNKYMKLIILKSKAGVAILLDKIKCRAMNITRNKNIISK